MRRGRRRLKALKFYVRVFERDGGVDRRVLNRTYEIHDYLGYVGMVSEVRNALWSVYVRKLRRSLGAGSKPIRVVS